MESVRSGVQAKAAHGLAVLVIDAQPALAMNLRAYLGERGCATSAAASAEEGLELLDQLRPDVVFLDFDLPGNDALLALAWLRARHPDAKVVMTIGRGGEEVAVHAMRAGAHDCLAKPVALGELEILLERLERQRRMERLLDYHDGRQGSGATLAEMVGTSTPMRELRATVARLLESETRMSEGTPAAVLIRGETGTGKAHLARALHFAGRRAGQPFIEVDCARIPRNLLEPELFGHERGERKRRIGLAEAAQAGTLFLDEIGAADPALQSKLLKLIEDQSVRAPGSLRDVRVDLRVIAATRQPLEDRIREGSFSADLYHRLRDAQLRVPPLRERGADVTRLAHHFLAAERMHHPDVALTPEADDALLRHAWPGNVRELRHVIEEAALLAGGNRITPAELGALHRGAPGTLARHPQAAHADPAEFPDDGIDLEDVERRLVAQALAKARGNVTRAARLLRLTRDTMRYRIEKFALGNKAPRE
jgi:DNA-binding NtrC family response regulator